MRKPTGSAPAEIARNQSARSKYAWAMETAGVSTKAHCSGASERADGPEGVGRDRPEGDLRLVGGKAPGGRAESILACWCAGPLRRRVSPIHRSAPGPESVPAAGRTAHHWYGAIARPKASASPGSAP